MKKETGSMMGESLKKHASIKARVMFKENPAYKGLKMKGKKKNLPQGKGKEGSMTEEMQDMGKE